MTENRELGAVIRVFDNPNDEFEFDVEYDFYGEESASGGSAKTSHFIVGAIVTALKNGKLTELLENFLDDVINSVDEEIQE